ncbi:MAG: methionyl-tRNA formyltransferase [Rhodoferax sp.]|nr:methionyl-tRNA formyltransferase [Rhodoferax sp.]
MRIIFAGTPEFAAVALRRLCADGFEVALVLTQPDRPAGRGLQVQPSAVKLVAQAHGIPVLQPRSLRLDGVAADAAQATRDAIAALDADVMVVAAYGLLLPRWLLDDMRLERTPQRVRHGCINIHASLLPRWRGAAPIHRAIEAGDALTGVCIMHMEEGLDTGGVILSESLAIQHDGPHADTTGSLQDRLAMLGAELVVTALRSAQRGPLVAQQQAVNGVCYAAKVSKLDARVDWTLSAAQVDRRVRAFNPAPGAWSTCNGQVLKLWRSQVLGGAVIGDTPGRILAVGAQGIDVACGASVLRLHELQRAGGRRLPAAEFMRGFELGVGMHLGDALAAA